MTSTVYIPTPISEHPKENGEYLIIDNKNRVERFQFSVSVGCWVCDSGDIAEDKEFPSDCRWLRQVDLSKMLEEAWNAGQLRLQQEIWHQDYDPSGEPKAPDLEKYLSSLNNQK